MPAPSITQKMLDLKDLENIWANLPDPIKLDILAYATALTKEVKEIGPGQREKLEKRLEIYQKQESAISWGHVYNQMLEELI